MYTIISAILSIFHLGQFKTTNTDYFAFRRIYNISDCKLSPQKSWVNVLPQDNFPFNTANTRRDLFTDNWSLFEWNFFRQLLISYLVQSSHCSLLPPAPPPPTANYIYCVTTTVYCSSVLEWPDWMNVWLHIFGSFLKVAEVDHIFILSFPQLWLWIFWHKSIGQRFARYFSQTRLVTLIPLFRMHWTRSYLIENFWIHLPKQKKCYVVHKNCQVEWQTVDS
jgi:hypothetical protein